METKPWWQSKAMIGAIVAVVCGLLKAFGKDIGIPQDAIVSNTETVIGAIAGLFSMYGTATRTTTITK